MIYWRVQKHQWSYFLLNSANQKEADNASSKQWKRFWQSKFPKLQKKKWVDDVQSTSLLTLDEIWIYYESPQKNGRFLVSHQSKSSPPKRHSTWTTVFGIKMGSCILTIVNQENPSTIHTAWAFLMYSITRFRRGRFVDSNFNCLAYKANVTFEKNTWLSWRLLKHPPLRRCLKNEN